MSEGIPDLLPDDLSGMRSTSPFTVLSSQAERLTAKTGGVVHGRVSRLSNIRLSDTFDRALAFELVVPALEDYVYQVMRVYYPIGGYPAEIDGTLTEEVGTRRAESHTEFFEFLRAGFGSERFKRIVSSLNGRSRGGNSSRTLGRPLA